MFSIGQSACDAHIYQWWHLSQKCTKGACGSLHISLILPNIWHPSRNIWGANRKFVRKNSDDYKNIAMANSHWWVASLGQKQANSLQHADSLQVRPTNIPNVSIIVKKIYLYLQILLTYWSLYVIGKCNTPTQYILLLIQQSHFMFYLYVFYCLSIM